MRQAAINEVWDLLDRQGLRDLLADGPEPLFATVSGAHLYGFASTNSDVDLRGAFVLPARALLRLRPPTETLTIEREHNGVELDWVAHDIRKFAKMMTRDNGYVLEQLFSPLVVAGGEEHDELCELGRGCVTRGLLRHYRGFAHGRRKLLTDPGATVKTLLYAYRVYLTGIRALRTGTVEANLLELNEEFRLPQVDELASRKRAGKEKSALAEGEAEAHGAELDALERRLEEAHDASSLPEFATTVDALDDFVVRIRLRRLEAGHG
ncbi:MAG: nucleotidyltransferase domain-containing protein [Polyangiaceae bacterium]